MAARARPTRRAERLVLGLAFAAALALRLPRLIAYDEDIDALRFALGVEDFDVAALRPHAPFYPVHIALGKLVAWVSGVAPVHALGVVSAVAGAASIALLGALARRVAGPRALIPALLLGLSTPLIALSSVKVHSDMAGTAFVLGAMWLLASSRRTEALVVAGLGLGVRLSYFPFALAQWFAVVRVDGTDGPRRTGLARARDLAFGVLLWGVPLVGIAGAEPLVRVGLTQGAGHFTTWGGTLVTVPSVSDRLHGVFWGLWANGLGGAYPDASSLRWLALPAWFTLFALAGRSLGSFTRASPAAAWGAMAYFAWAFVGQNIAYKPRHLLPLVPLVLLAIAVGVGRSRGRARWIAGVALGVVVVVGSVDTWALVRAHEVPSPAAQVVAAISENTEDPRPIVTRDLGRWLRERAPSRRVLEPVDVLEALSEAAPSGPVLVTSEALPKGGVDALVRAGFAVRTELAAPRSRYVDALWSDLALLEVRAVASPTGTPAQTPPTPPR